MLGIYCLIGAALAAMVRVTLFIKARFGATARVTLLIASASQEP
jgi:hypothetical protein